MRQGPAHALFPTGLRAPCSSRLAMPFIVEDLVPVMRRSGGKEAAQAMSEIGRVALEGGRTER